MGDGVEHYGADHATMISVTGKPLRAKKMKKVMISVGPIPGRLDSVKYITNRFKGGLALKTALALKPDYNVTVVQWKHTENNAKDNFFNVILVEDVEEYYNYVKANASTFDAFIFAAAVANLVPVQTWTGKFPSHNYKEGDVIPLNFKIAPRAIDVVKQINPYACVIGYKLFDGQEQEMFKAARITLAESKANVIFANSPQDAAKHKWAFTQSGAQIPMTFDEHVQFIRKAIDSEYYHTETYDKLETMSATPIGIFNKYWSARVIEAFMDHYEHGCFAIEHGDSIMVSGRGHKKVSTVFDVNHGTRKILANYKATSNIPLIEKYMRGNKFDIVVHRHKFLRNGTVIPYELPGTVAEANMLQQWHYPHGFDINEHGSVQGYTVRDTDFRDYRAIYPSKYHSVPAFMRAAVDHAKKMHSRVLEVGAGNFPLFEDSVLVDPNVKVFGRENTTWQSLLLDERDFNLVLLHNSINYLDSVQIQLLKTKIGSTGQILANTFGQLANYKITDDEIAVTDENQQYILHLLFKESGRCYEHWFYNYGTDFWLNMGFTIRSYADNSLQLRYTI